MPSDKEGLDSHKVIKLSEKKMVWEKKINKKLSEQDLLSCDLA